MKTHLLEILFHIILPSEVAHLPGAVAGAVAVQHCRQLRAAQLEGRLYVRSTGTGRVGRTVNTARSANRRQAARSVAVQGRTTRAARSVAVESRTRPTVRSAGRARWNAGRWTVQRSTGTQNPGVRSTNLELNNDEIDGMRDHSGNGLRGQQNGILELGIPTV